MSLQSTDGPGIPDRGIINATYMMIFLNAQLSKWAKDHHVNTEKAQLRFILSIESDKLDEVHLSLSYDEEDGEQVIHAGYVGQKLNDKERKFCEKLPVYTLRDLHQTPPYSVVKNKLDNLKDRTGIVEEVALGFHNILVDACDITGELSAAMATNNGSAILFLRNQELYVTKIEFYAKDIMNFLKGIENKRSLAIREAISSLVVNIGHL